MHEKEIETRCTCGRPNGRAGRGRLCHRCLIRAIDEALADQGGARLVYSVTNGLPVAPGQEAE